MVLEMHWTYCMFGVFLFGKKFFMILSNGTEGNTEAVYGNNIIKGKY